MRRGYNRTRNPIDSVFIILSFTFYLFFFLYRSLLCLSFDVSQYRIVLRQRSFSKYIRMQILSTNRNIFFFLLHSFSSLQIVLRLAGKKKEKKVIHANTFYVIYIVDWKKRSRERQFSLS